MDLGGRSFRLSKFWYILVTAAMSMAFIAPVAFAQTTDDVTVTVSIESLSQITVTPASLNFSQTPGQEVSPSRKIDIKNTGSVNVSQIHAYTDTLTTENVRPYGSPVSTSYSAGGVIVIRNETNQSFYWAGRLEWNQTEDLSNLVRTGVTSPVSWGFVRNASREYVWLIGNGTPSVGANFAMCNGTGSQFAIEDDVDNGTTATRTPVATAVTRDAGDNNYGYFSVGDSRTALANSCVAIDTNCTRVYIYAYDRRSPFNSCANSKYLQFANLIPNDIHTINMTVFVPFGIPGQPGQLNTSTFTVSAT